MCQNKIFLIDRVALGCARIFSNITMLLQLIPQSKYLAQKLSGDIPKNIYIHQWIVYYPL